MTLTGWNLWALSMVLMHLEYAYHKLIKDSNMQIFLLREARLFRFIKNQRQDTIWNTIILMDTSIKLRSPFKGWVTWFACLLAKLTIGFGITIIHVLHSRSIMWYSKVPCWFACRLSTNALQSIQKITFEMFNSCAYFIAWSKAHAFTSSASDLPESCIVFALKNVPSSLCRQWLIPTLFSSMKSVASILIFRYFFCGFVYHEYASIVWIALNGWEVFWAWLHSWRNCIVREIKMFGVVSTSFQSFSFCLFQIYHKTITILDWRLELLVSQSLKVSSLAGPTW